MDEDDTCEASKVRSSSRHQGRTVPHAGKSIDPQFHWVRRRKYCKRVGNDEGKVSYAYNTLLRRHHTDLQAEQFL